MYGIVASTIAGSEKPAAAISADCLLDAETQGGVDVREPQRTERHPPAILSHQPVDPLRQDAQILIDDIDEPRRDDRVERVCGERRAQSVGEYAVESGARRCRRGEFASNRDVVEAARRQRKFVQIDPRRRVRCVGSRATAAD